MTLQVGLLEAGIAVAVLAGACGATWFAADAHYSKQLSSLEGQFEAAAKAQRAAVDAKIAKDQDTAKEVDSEAQQQISSMASVIADLSMRSAARSHSGALCATSSGAPVARVQSDRSAAPASSGSPAAPPAAAPAAAAVSAPGIDLGALSDALEIGVESVKAELLWRQYARETGQAK